MREMKSVVLSSKAGGVFSGPKTLHVEADGCIVNIQVGLHDENGNRVTHVSVDANGDRYSGETQWWVAPGSKVTSKGVGLRVVEKAQRKSRHGDRKRSSRR